MQCFLHGEWVFGFVVYTVWLSWPVFFVFSLMQGSYLLSPAMDGMFGYRRSTWQYRKCTKTAAMLEIPKLPHVSVLSFTITVLCTFFQCHFYLLHPNQQFN